MTNYKMDNEIIETEAEIDNIIPIAKHSYN